MMMNTTLEQLRSLKLAGMASGLQEQLTQPGMTGMSFEERLALLVDREVHWRLSLRQCTSRSTSRARRSSKLMPVMPGWVSCSCKPLAIPASLRLRSCSNVVFIIMLYSFELGYLVCRYGVTVISGNGLA